MGRCADRQRVILTGQGGQCGCYFGEARLTIATTSTDRDHRQRSRTAVLLDSGVWLEVGSSSA